ncbi:MAG: penicillin-binding transpeptidase domain-containing protein [Ruminococcus flavefaciens]|nr:penicillin-binding transpeptidase domain-containing protein [Ruminococcus flavefaciens]MCM1229326.1 penicillin-binding transpeptidase domain-containing protein [Ruminococcus flavefaciens]
MKSIKRCQKIMTVFLFAFILGMAGLVFKIIKNAPFYMTHSSNYELGMVYDRNGGVLFDGMGKGDYADDYFIDVGNLIGDDKGQMTNTLVAKNIDKLNNYSFSAGLVKEGGKAGIYTTLDHEANRAVYNAYMGAKGCAVAYNYQTGELLVCTSLPSLDPTKGYANIDNMESGTLISKAMYGTVPGSTQKVSTVISALEIMGREKLFSKSYSCSGHYTNNSGKVIDCHNTYGHGTQDIQQAVENSCNPFFAQLIEDSDMPLERVKAMYTKLGYAVSDDKDEKEIEYFDIDGIQCEKASAKLTDSDDFNTQWSCIGQSETLVSPIQLMMWQSAIANETGRMTMPHLISKVTDVYGEDTEVMGTEFSEQVFSTGTASTVKQILLTNGANHYQWSIPNYTIGIKSGTAQVKDGAEENALLVGFVDDPANPIAFCVLLENKYSTSATAENIVTVMLDNLCS